MVNGKRQKVNVWKKTYLENPLPYFYHLPFDFSLSSIKYSMNNSVNMLMHTGNNFIYNSVGQIG